MEDRVQLKKFQSVNPSLDLTPDREMKLDYATITTKTVGVALVISNDVVNDPECKKSLIHENSKKLCEFLLQFDYFVHHRQNIAKQEFVELCKRLAEYKYPSNCKRLVVAFSGYGIDGVLQLRDGERIFLEDVLCYFKSTNATLLGSMIRLFFVDTHYVSPVGSLVQDNSAIVKASNFCGFLNRIEKDVNLLVAYSTLHYHDQDSEHFNLHGRWTSCLVDELLLVQSQFASLQSVLTKVNETMAGIATAAKCFHIVDYCSSPEELFILPAFDTTVAVSFPISQLKDEKLNLDSFRADNLLYTTPLLKDLFQYITPQYAAEWEVVGTLLDIPSGELRAIELAYPTNIKWCCNQMLKRWLEMDSTATWEKLFTVIESPAVSYTPDRVTSKLSQFNTSLVSETSSDTISIHHDHGSNEPLQGVQRMANNTIGISLTASTQYPAYDHAKATTNCIAMATVQAPPYEIQCRSPVDIVTVIDHSGSMAGRKLDLVKKTLLFVIDQLKSCDRLSLVLYDNEVSLEFPLMPMTKENKEFTKFKVEKIRQRGSTNLCGGLLKGMEQIILRDSEWKAEIASVLLFTDGLANCGITNHQTIIAAINDLIGSSAKAEVLDKCRPIFHQSPPKSFMQGPPPVPIHQKVEQKILSTTQLQKDPCLHHTQAPQQTAPHIHQQTSQFMQQQFQAMPLQQETSEPMYDVSSCTVGFEGTIYTFGFGSDHNGKLLTDISNTGDGMYYFIDSTEKIGECFADCLGGLLSVVGQNVTLTVEAQPHCTLGTVHYKNKCQMEPDNKKCAVYLGDLQSEEERNIIIPISLEAMESECVDQPLIRVTLSYLNVITTQRHTTSVDLTVDRKSVIDLQPNETINIHLQRVQVALALEEAGKIAPVNLQRARIILEESNKSVLKSTVAESELCQELQTDLVEAIENLKDQHTYQQFGSNFIANRSQGHIAQRSPTSYPTKYKCEMKIKSPRY